MARFDQYLRLFISVFITHCFVFLSVQAGVPTEQVRDTTNKLLAVFEDPYFSEDSRSDERRERIIEVADERIDWYALCRSCLGRHWTKRTKEEKKAKREAEFKAAKETNLAIVQTQRWVLESGILYDRSGQSFILNSTLNFVMLDGDQTTIQLDLNALSGWNGVGGITFDGRVTKYEINEGKENNCRSQNNRSMI